MNYAPIFLVLLLLLCYSITVTIYKNCRNRRQGDPSLLGAKQTSLLSLGSLSKRHTRRPAFSTKLNHAAARFLGVAMIQPCPNPARMRLRAPRRCFSSSIEMQVPRSACAAQARLLLTCSRPVSRSQDTCSAPVKLDIAAQQVSLQTLVPQRNPRPPYPSPPPRKKDNRWNRCGRRGPQKQSGRRTVRCAGPIFDIWCRSLMRRSRALKGQYFCCRS